MNTVRLADADHVVTAISPLEIGAAGAIRRIPRGRKMATRPVAKRAPIARHG